MTDPRPPRNYFVRSFRRDAGMLSRVADSLYWMSRYIERAENIARIVDVNLQLLLDLHNLNEESNSGLEKPMKLDYEMNDPADPESIYTRSDHYSYASKGIPIIFYTTGLHRDYHYVTDEVSKIEFPKMAHIAQLVYTTGVKVANLDHVPVRDNKGPRTGFGSKAEVIRK